MELSIAMTVTAERERETEKEGELKRLTYKPKSIKNTSRKGNNIFIGTHM